VDRILAVCGWADWSWQVACIQKLDGLDFMLIGAGL
jgi:hypothetical protein